MNNAAISSKLADILAKINTILNDYMQMEEEYLQLLSERNILKDKVQDQNKLIKTLEERIQQLKIAKESTSVDSENGAIKETIEQFIQDIDQCIDLLDN